MVMVGESPGRARAHTMLGAIKATGEEQSDGHPGILFERLQEASNQDVKSESRISALTMALHATRVNDIPASDPITIKPSVVAPYTIFTPEGSLEVDSDDILDALKQDETDLRKWCAGLPPKKSFLGTDSRLPFTRRSTLADKPELDILLAETKTEYRGHSYLPLTAHTIRRLSPYWKGEKPIANTKLFECIMINHEINGVHADHVVAALERIGTHCKHLLVVSPIHTSELGNVFNREAGNINPGNDWDHILRCFPHLKYLAFLHPADEPVELSRSTLYALHTAVSHHQAAQEIKGFKYKGPTQLLANFHYDMAIHYANKTI